MVGTKQPPHVLILGAGTTGLLIAQGLKKNNSPFSIFEREDRTQYRDHPREWSMGLFWGAESIQATLPEDLMARFDEAKSRPNYEPDEENRGWWPLYNGKTGELLTKMWARNLVRVSRSKLRRLFSEGLDVNYGKLAVKVDDDGTKVTVHFQDGTTAVGDAVIGCDGGKSTVRSQLLPPEKAALSALPLRVANVATTFTAEQARFIMDTRHPIVSPGVHPHRPAFCILIVVNAEDESRPETWVIQLLITEWGTNEVLPTSEERLAWIKRNAADFGEPWRSAAQWLKDDLYVPPDQLKYWKEPVPWDNHGGRITLGGDALHPMPPFRGQGLNNAMEDASQYVKAILSVTSGEKSLPEAIDAYDAEAIERGRKEINISATQAEYIHNFDRLLDSPGLKQGLDRPVAQQ